MEGLDGERMMRRDWEEFRIRGEFKAGRRVV